MPYHMHLFIGMRPHQSISSLIQNVKAESSKWIKSEGLSSNFAWQEGYGAFSYSKSHVPDVISYIEHQEAHHKKQSFLSEYQAMLKAFAIEYDQQYIFKELL
jgi:putative transposase